MSIGSNSQGSKPSKSPHYDDGSSSTGWFVGIVVALALLAIAYLVFSANSVAPTYVGTVPMSSASSDQGM